MAVTASFANDILTVIADALDNNVEASRNAAGTLLVNGGAVNVVGGTPTVANTALIQMFGQGGNDEHVHRCLPHAARRMDGTSAAAAMSGSARNI